MQVPLAADKFHKLEDELIASHQVVLTDTSWDSRYPSGTLQTTDGKIAANWRYDGNALNVELTKHDGYPAFLANAGLKSKLEAAIKNL